jgi:CDP-6-deoxy-D-xylo-4-hexulose-3-dehydrase
VYSHFGYNLKATDMQASIGCAQLRKIEDFTRKRRENFDTLYKLLEDLQDSLILPQACPDSKPSWFGFLLTCKKGVSRNAIVQHLEGKGIQTRMLFAGNFLKHPCFSTLPNDGSVYRVAGTLENTDRILNDTFWIGVAPFMTKEMLSDMTEEIHSAVLQNRG